MRILAATTNLKNKDKNETANCDNTQQSVYKKISAKNHFLNVQDLASLKKICAVSDFVQVSFSKVCIFYDKSYPFQF